MPMADAHFSRNESHGDKRTCGYHATRKMNKLILP
jgi:hypothetical protein